MRIFRWLRHPRGWGPLPILMAPLVVIFVLAARGPKDSNLWNIVLIGIFAAWFYALLSLPACWARLLASRRWSPEELPRSEAAWRSRLRSALWNGIKLTVVLMMAYLLIGFAETATSVEDPPDYANSVTLARGARSVAMTLDPDERSCSEVVEVSVRPASAAIRVVSEGRTVSPVTETDGKAVFRLRLSSGRSASSCYYQFPKVVSSGHRVPVSFYAPTTGSASDSTPPPTRASGGYWGWRCSAVPGGSGCAVMAVLDYNPGAVLTTLALLLIGALIAAGLSLLFTVTRALLDGWGEDLPVAGRLVWAGVGSAWEELKDWLRPQVDRK